jgi:inhibitor of cysteine peptidase
MKDRKKPAAGRGRLLALLIMLALFTASCSNSGGSIPASPVPVQTDVPAPTGELAPPDIPVANTPALTDMPVPADTPAATMEDKKIIYGKARVDSIEILILESFPVQINVVARGSLPDGCTEIGEVVRNRSGNEFTVKITTVRPTDAICTQALVPFEEIVSLDVYGLKAGTYTVEVNGVTDKFKLDIDNMPQGGALPELLEFHFG